MTPTQQFLEQLKGYYLRHGGGQLRNVGDDVEKLISLVETYERAFEQMANRQDSLSSVYCILVVAKALADAAKIVEGKD